MPTGLEKRSGALRAEHRADQVAELGAELVVVQRRGGRAAVPAYLGRHRPPGGEGDLDVGVLLAQRRIRDHLHPVAQLDDVGPHQHLLLQLGRSDPAEGDRRRRTVPQAELRLHARGRPGHVGESRRSRGDAHVDLRHLGGGDVLRCQKRKHAVDHGMRQRSTRIELVAVGRDVPRLAESRVDPTGIGLCAHHGQVPEVTLQCLRACRQSLLDESGREHAVHRGLAGMHALEVASRHHPQPRRLGGSCRDRMLDLFVIEPHRAGRRGRRADVPGRARHVPSDVVVRFSRCVRDTCLDLEPQREGGQGSPPGDGSAVGDRHDRRPYRAAAVHRRSRRVVHVVEVQYV